MPEKKNIILGITGSIAAYKAVVLLRLLKKLGYDIQVLMTDYAREFVNPLTFASLSERPVLREFFNPENGEWNNHVKLSIWADLMVIAPATANTIAKMAYGIADNLLLTTYLSARCPVIVAPAMDVDMYMHPATQRNIEILKNNGVIIIEPVEGELASGLEGKGRMEEPDKIADFIYNFFENIDKKKKVLEQKKIIVTAGPTYEKIDPVRFIGNYSSGLMGFAIAESLANYGAKVILISGPVNLSCKSKNVERIDVESANEMYDMALKFFPNCDGAILAAAVSDYTPIEQKNNKIKHSENILELRLKPTPDIARSLGEIKKNNQFLIGFALETENEIDNAKEKLLKKNFDFIVINSLNDEGAGFRYKTNKITILDKNNNLYKYPLKTKYEVAEDIVTKLCELIYKI